MTENIYMPITSLDAVLHQMLLKLLLICLRMDAIVQNEGKILFVMFTHF